MNFSSSANLFEARKYFHWEEGGLTTRLDRVFKDQFCNEF